MKKDQKTQLVDEIAEQIDSAAAVYAIDYRGISVPQAAELRARLRDADATFKIVKNTLTARAADKSDSSSAEQLKAFVLEGPTALAFIKGDPALAAKALDSFARENNVLDFKGGTLGSELLSADDIRSIARLPSRERLNAQLAGVVASPLTTLVRGLGSMISGLAVALGQVARRKDAEPQSQAEATEEAAQDEQAPDGQDKQDEQEEEQKQETEAGQ